MRPVLCPASSIARKPSSIRRTPCWTRSSVAWALISLSRDRPFSVPGFEFAFRDRQSFCRSLTVLDRFVRTSWSFERSIARLFVSTHHGGLDGFPSDQNVRSHERIPRASLGADYR